MICCLSANGFSQVKSLSKKSTDPLDQVRTTYESDPKFALSLLDDEIRKSRKKASKLRLAEAYIVLARVNQFLGDLESAEENLFEASKYFKVQGKTKKFQQNSDLLVEYHLVKGNIYLDRRKFKEAGLQFSKCKKYRGDYIFLILCQEGDGDLAAAQDEHEEASRIYKNLKTNKNLSAKDQARIESKLANSLASLGKISEANAAYQNANVIEAEDSYAYDSNDSGADGLPDKYANKRSKYLDKARDNIVNNAKLNKLDPIEISVENIKEMKEKELPKLAIQREQIELSKLYLKENKFEESEAVLDEVILAPDKNLSELPEAFEIKAKIGEEKKDYKQAYEFLKKRFEGTQNAELAGFEKDGLIKEKYALEKNLKDYKIQEKESIIQKIRNRSTLILFGFLSLLTLGSLLFSFFLWRNVQAKNRANKLLELKSLRTQMNPHFIFNSMNSINNFIALNDEKSANKYIADFSKLIRKIMDFSQREFISLEEEINLLEIYLRLEQMRFRDKFDYTFKVDQELRESEKKIPPMLIQPLLENAVWHGLRYKKEKGHLDLSISRKGSNVEVKIDDDGIGRERSIALKTKNQKQYKSTGISNINKRIDLINDLYNKKFTLKTEDKNNEAEDKGTSVKLNLNL